MKLRIDKLLFALALACALLAGVALADAMYTVEPAAVYVVRDGKTSKLGTLKAGVKVEVVAKKGDWAALEKGKNVGFVQLSSLVSVKKLTAETRYTRCSTPLYASYTKTAKKLMTIPEGEAVKVVARAGKRVKVKYSGKTGWVKTADLTKKKPEGGRQRIGYAADDGTPVYNGKGKVITELDKGDQVLVIAKKGKKLRVTHRGRVAYMNEADVVYEDPTAPAKPAPKPTADTTSYTPARGTAQEMDWWTSDIQTIFDRGVKAKITDVETGLCWWEIRYGGQNHADCQPLTAKDTAILKKVYGGKWTWDRRAIFVTIDGVNYAASMNGMPHGGGSIKNNNFSGHHCIHFTNSRTHGSNRRCPLHQAAIKTAAAATLK